MVHEIARVHRRVRLGYATSSAASAPNASEIGQGASMRDGKCGPGGELTLASSLGGVGWSKPFPRPRRPCKPGKPCATKRKYTCCLEGLLGDGECARALCRLR